MDAHLRSLVSKKKKRFTDESIGVDLDLSYITARIIAMGFPSEGSESMVRNPLSDVQKFFHARHPDRELVFNLCSERVYKLESAFPRCQRFPFDDHTPPPLEMVADFCRAAQVWLSADANNVVAVHCKAGKGRTGVMICSLLIALGICRTAHEALRMFGEQRTHDGKGVTIPSQARIVYYFEQWLRRGLPQDLALVSPTYKITRVRFVTVPNFDVGETGCDPYMVASISNRSLLNAKCWDLRTHEKKLRHFKTKHGLVDLDVSKYSLFVRDNVRLTLKVGMTVTLLPICMGIPATHLHPFALIPDYSHSDDLMLVINFHTAFVDSHTHLVFEKAMCDHACKDKAERYFDRAFAVEVFLERIDNGPLATAAGFNACYNTARASLNPALQ